MPPKPARNPREHLREGPTTHRIILGDSREMPEIPDASVHLVVTSPPYANLKSYEAGNPSQLGDIDDYEKFLDELDKVWEQCARVLVPGGRICCVVGDVNVARSNGGRHYVLPLAADIRIRGRRLGLDRQRTTCDGSGRSGRTFLGPRSENTPLHSRSRSPAG